MLFCSKEFELVEIGSNLIENLPVNEQHSDRIYCCEVNQHPAIYFSGVGHWVFATEDDRDKEYERITVILMFRQSGYVSPLNIKTVDSHCNLPLNLKQVNFLTLSSEFNGIEFHFDNSQANWLFSSLKIREIEYKRLMDILLGG